MLAARVCAFGVPAAAAGAVPGFAHPPLFQRLAQQHVFINTDDASSVAGARGDGLGGNLGHRLQLAIAANSPTPDARVPQAPPQRGVRRGPAACTPTALSDEIQLLALDSADVQRRLPPRLPARRRHRPPRPRLEQAAGDRLRGANCPSTEGVCSPEVDHCSCTPGRRRRTWSGSWRTPADAGRGRAAPGQPLDVEELPLRGARERLPAARRRCRPGGRRPSS